MEKRSKPYHHGNLPAALIEESLRFLAAHGSENLSLREIARAVGVSPNAPYRHFKSKEELLARLADHGYLELSAALKQIEASDGAGKRFRAYGKTVESFACQHPPLFRIMIQASGKPSEGKTACFEVLQDHVSALMEAPAKTDKVLNGALTAWSAFFGFADAMAAKALPAETNEYDARTVGRMLARGLRN